MKKLTMILLAAGAIALGSFAAIAGARHHSPEKRIEHMKKALNLSDAQAAQIKTVFKEHQPEMKADRDAMKAAAKGSDAKKAAFEKMRADREALKAQITPILTADQQAKWDQMMAKHEHWHDKKGSEAAPAQK
ncbi:MAG TPA: periplasmic heavy metal sensor [Candidatus Kapabacteria bacterium]|jgi:septal ring factor EnvC (AmiA/AmiB activator)|nr:periplasmic heavy metal sensor [Candidatus Kapabacteria bacterium]